MDQIRSTVYLTDPDRVRQDRPRSDGLGRLRQVDRTIDPGDRIRYAEAAAITGMSTRWLVMQVDTGTLTRTGGRRGDAHHTWLSRSECEALALSRYRRGHTSPYWLTMTAAAAILGIARKNAHQARQDGRLPAQRAANGDFLIRRDDILALVNTREIRPRP